MFITAVCGKLSELCYMDPLQGFVCSFFVLETFTVFQIRNTAAKFNNELLNCSIKLKELIYSKNVPRVRTRISPG